MRRRRALAVLVLAGWLAACTPHAEPAPPRTAHYRDDKPGPTRCPGQADDEPPIVGPCPS